MKNKNDQGFSLIEILVAIVILAAFVVPTCSALVLSAQMTEKTNDLMKAHLAVSSAVETLMAEGIPAGITSPIQDYGVTSREVEVPNDEGEGTHRETVKTDRFPLVVIEVVPIADKLWYSVTVTSNDRLIEVKTSVRAVKASGGGA